jgi:hypothetical protein
LCIQGNTIISKILSPKRKRLQDISAAQEVQRGLPLNLEWHDRDGYFKIQQTPFSFTVQLSKSKKSTGRANGGGPRPWMDAPLSHQVTKVHTFSFLAIPPILRIVAQTGHKQGKHTPFPL